MIGKGQGTVVEQGRCPLRMSMSVSMCLRVCDKDPNMTPNQTALLEPDRERMKSPELQSWLLTKACHPVSL